MDLSSRFETSVCNIFFKANILYIVFKEDADVELSHINEIISIREKLQQKQKCLTLVDIRKIWHAEKEAREKAASEAMIRFNIALAIISDSLPTKILGNFYIKFDKPSVPTKMFNDEPIAIDWLNNMGNIKTP